MMSLSNEEVAKFGFAVKYAEDLYSPSSGMPDGIGLKSKIKNLGWDVVAYLMVAEPSFDHKTLLIGDLGHYVFIGFLARSAADPNAYIAAIRGTEGIAEWFIDAEFSQVPYPGTDGANVEKGFWSLYQTMQLCDTNGQNCSPAANGIATTIGPQGKVTVLGHSLGSALATYLSLDTALLINDRVSAVMFASPKTGNNVFTAYYASKLGGRYSLYNYVLDLVPYVPFSLPAQNIEYETLPGPTIITPWTSQADVKVDIGCSHQIICYCSEIDYQLALSTFPDEVGCDCSSAQQSGDQTKPCCVCGPTEFSANEILSDILALVIEAAAGNAVLLKQIAKKMGWKPK